MRLLTVGLVLVLGQVARAEIQFSYKDLGTFGGRHSRPGDINNSGQVVGWASNSTTTNLRDYDWFSGTWKQQSGSWEPRNAFLYDYNTMYNLDRPDEMSEANAISNSGRIVGAVGNASNTERAFRLRNGPLDETDELGFLNGTVRASRASDVNDVGQTVGTTYDGQGFTGFVYEGERMRSLGPLLGSPSHVTAINNRGQVVGGSYIQPGHTGPFHAFLHDLNTGRTRDLAQDIWNAQTLAADINDNGVVVGSIDQGGGGHAFIWDDGKVTELPKLPGMQFNDAFAINNKGD